MPYNARHRSKIAKGETAMGYKNWEGAASNLLANDWVCGHCGHQVGGDTGYCRYDRLSSGGGRSVGSMIYICPNCAKPTYFEFKGGQHPLPRFGKLFRHLPDDIQSLYDDICRSVSAGACTASVLASRKMLAHIAVQEGASDNMTFKQYVEYLDDEHVVPRSAKGWVDFIRSKGNEATHEIVMAEKDEAEAMATFIEQILFSVYEFPAMLPSEPE